MRARLAVILALAAIVAACAAPVPRPVAEQGRRPDGFPDAYYLDAARRGQPVYEIDAGSSSVVIEVRRAGTLAQLGHDHAVVSHDVAGYVAPGASRADLYVPLDRMVVDEREARAEARFDGQPPDDAIEGTRGNMLGKLDAAAYPFAVIGVRGIEKDAAGASWLNATLTIKGVTREVRIPAQVASAAEEVSVSGSVTVAQTSFGIAPYSVLAGALQVRDEVDIRFRIRARRMPL